MFKTLNEKCPSFKYTDDFKPQSILIKWDKNLDKLVLLTEKDHA